MPCDKPKFPTYPEVKLTGSPLKNDKYITSLQNISNTLENFITTINGSLTDIEKGGKQSSNARYNANIVKRELKKLDDTWKKRKNEDAKKTSRVSNFRVSNLTVPYKKLFDNSDDTRYRSENKNLFASKTDNIKDDQIKKMAKMLKDYATISGTIEKTLFSALETLTNTATKLQEATKVILTAIENIKVLPDIPDNDSFERIIEFLHSYIDGICEVENPEIDFCMK